MLAQRWSRLQHKSPLGIAKVVAAVGMVAVSWTGVVIGGNVVGAGVVIVIGVVERRQG